MQYAYMLLALVYILLISACLLKMRQLRLRREEAEQEMAKLHAQLESLHAMVRESTPYLLMGIKVEQLRRERAAALEEMGIQMGVIPPPEDGRCH